MRRISRISSGFGLAPWIVVAVLLLATGAPVTARDVAAAPVEVGADSTDTPAALSAAPGNGNVTTRPSTMPPAAVGPGLASDGTGPLGLGALVGAIVAGGAALRERFRER